MDISGIINELQTLSDPKYKANAVKMGIPENFSIGVSTGDVRRIAKNMDKSNELAKSLWNSGYHEAKLLAVLLFDKKSLSFSDIRSMIPDVTSWDLCDHLCKNLILKMKGYDILIADWISSPQTYTKRAAFTLIASAAVHEKDLSGEKIDGYLQYVKEYSKDEREHVKKAVSWALRELGKIDFTTQEKAILLAHELLASDHKAQKWIAKDALKELESLVKVKGRRRLISSHSKMGHDEQ